MSGIIGSVGSKSGVIGQTDLDYEEGIWTPRANAGSGYSFGNASSGGKYFKIGKLVYIACSLYDAKDTAPGGTFTGDVIFSQLPFTSSSEFTQPLCWMNFNLLTPATTAQKWLSRNVNGQLYIYIYQLNLSTQLNATDFGTYTDMICSGFYYTD